MPPFNLRRPLTPALQTLTSGRATTPTSTRTLHTTPLLLKQQQHQNPPRLQLPDSEIKHVFILGGGNGGQVINKTSSAAQLTHIPTGIVVKSQATRSRSQNYKIARQILADKVDEKLNGEKSRTQVKQAHVSKKKSSADKKKRRKYRALEEAKNGEVQVEGDGDGGADGISEDGGSVYEDVRGTAIK